MPFERKKTGFSLRKSKSGNLSGRQVAQNIALGALGLVAAILIILLIGYGAEQLFGKPSSQALASDSQETIPEKNPSEEQSRPEENQNDPQQSVEEPETSDLPDTGIAAAPTIDPELEMATSTIPTIQPFAATPTPIPRTHNAFVIEAVPLTKQDRSLNCEFISASDLAGYYGHPLSWQSIFLAVGFDPNGNPHVGFVGKSVDDAPRQLYPNGYGVYAEPIARGMTELGVEAKSYYNMGIEWLKLEILAKRPVIVWAPFDMEAAEPAGWKTADGKTWIKAIRGEHTFTVIGYNDTGVYVHDPWYGSERFFTWPVFEQAWSYLDQMAVSVQPETQ